MKFKIKITPEQYKKIKINCLSSEYFDRKKEIKRRLVGKIRIPPFNEEMTIMIFVEFPHILYLEGSLPKIFYGENVRLFYLNQLKPFLDILQQTLSKKFESFSDYSLWEIQRIDVCYAWKFSSPQEVLKVLQFTQSLEYLRKIRTVWPNESVDFVGGNTKVKFYLKEPEFKKNGLQKLIKDEQTEFAKDILLLAENVLRFEVTYRRKALRDYFKKDYIRYDIFSDDSILIDMMNKILVNFSANIDKVLVKYESVIKALNVEYKSNKASRLFCWHYVFNQSKLSVKNLVKKYSNSSYISANKSDLKKAKIHIPTMLDISPFKFPIPSPLVVNPPLDDTAVAVATRKILEILNKEKEWPPQLRIPFWRL